MSAPETPGARPANASGRHLGLGVVLVCLAASRFYYRFVLGGGFDVTPLHRYVQFVDLEILQDSLFESVFYLHDQAPLLNLLNGVAIRLSPDLHPAWLEAFFFGLTVVLAVSLFGVIHRVTTRARVLVATVVTALYVASPAVYVYESWLLYHQPTAALLCLSVLLCLRFGDRPTLGRGLAFFGCLATVALVRNLYGLVWFGALFGGLLVMRLSAPRRLYWSALPAAAVLVLFACKQQYLFGTPSTGDAFVGPNLAVRAQGSYGREALLSRARLGGAAPILAIPPLSPLEAYEGVVALPPPTGVRALDRTEMSSGGVNLHCLGYLAVGRAYRAAAIDFFRENPEQYWASVWRAWDYGYFRPTTTDAQLRKSQSHDVLLPVLLPVEELLGHRDRYNSLPLVVLYGLSMLYAAGRLVARLWVGRVDRPVDGALFFLFVTIVYASLSTTLISFGDYQRYRYALDPLYCVCAVLLYDAVIGVGARLVSAVRGSPGDAR